MTRKDKIGLGFLICLFVVFAALLVATLRPISNTVRKPEDSVIVQQRIKNLQKSR